MDESGAIVDKVMFKDAMRLPSEERSPPSVFDYHKRRDQDDDHADHRCQFRVHQNLWSASQPRGNPSCEAAGFGARQVSLRRLLNNWRSEELLLLDQSLPSSGSGN